MEPRSDSGIGFEPSKMAEVGKIASILSTLRDLVFEVSGVFSIEGAIALETLAGEIRAKLAKGQ